ncbi:hypothetical protein L2E82_31261 [Cichorium intybus]|uniref:Uncharacterized protein n=1 Tax=Cichorium intybus TaxID=13427 RepID=A0ACB9D3C9_CICIN|nr:hypothetical protein L2E82_31261 [Cichorium intybus]
MVPPPIRVMPDFKSIFAQKLLTKSPRQKPYIPLGGSPENSPLSINATSAEQRKIFDEKDVSNFSLGCEDESVSQKTSDQECPTTLDSSVEIPKLPLTGDESGGNNDTTETVHGETSQVLTGGDVKSVDSNDRITPGKASYIHFTSMVKASRFWMFLLSHLCMATYLLVT